MIPLVALHSPAREPESRIRLAIDRAAALFLRDGIAAARMTDIAKAVDVGVATLYRRFGTKTALAIQTGAYLWDRFNALIRVEVEEDGFLMASGAQRLMLLFNAYCETYLAHPDFVRFIDEFDHMVAAEGVTPDELAAYGEAIDRFYFIFEDAYAMGLADGSITREVDFAIFYRAVAHSTMGIAQRVVRGTIIPSDDVSRGTDELACVLQMARLMLGVSDDVTA